MMRPDPFLPDVDAAVLNKLSITLTSELLSQNRLILLSGSASFIDLQVTPEFLLNRVKLYIC